VQTLRESEVHLSIRPGLQEIWHSPLHISDFCFSNLARLNVNYCKFLSDAVLPFHLLPLLPKLETLEVRYCDYVKTVFDVKSTRKGILITFAVKNLILSNLSNLESVWNEDPHGILSMHQLQYVYVEECKVLKSVFPASVAKDFVELENVQNCEELMTIVAEDNTDLGLEFTFPCPCVRSLKLRGLPNFEYIYYSLKSHTQDQLFTKKVLLSHHFLLASCFVNGSMSAN